MAADGSAVLAWDQATGLDHEAARYAIAPADEPFTRTRTLAADAGLADLAVRPDGVAAAVVDRKTGGLAFRRRSATAPRFGVEEIPTGDQPDGADVAFDRSGRLLLAWSRPAGDTTATVLVGRRG
jgi:hypothetical protein